MAVGWKPHFQPSLACLVAQDSCASSAGLVGYTRLTENMVPPLPLQCGVDASRLAKAHVDWLAQVASADEAELFFCSGADFGCSDEVYQPEGQGRGWKTHPSTQCKLFPAPAPPTHP